VRVIRRFRDKVFNITIRNLQGVQKGVAKLSVNGQELPDNLIPLSIMQTNNTVVAEMG